MAEYRSGDRVLVNMSAGIVPGSEGVPDWQPGTVEERLENGEYRIRLDQPIGGRTADKEAAPEHVRPLS
jgi:hypothetical protein